MPTVTTISVDDAKAKLAAGWVTVDVATSRDYRLGHIPDAWWTTRARLDATAGKLPDAPGYLATSEDGVVAAYAASELAALTGKPTAALDRGTAAWKAAGSALEEGETHHADEADDVWLKPYERKGVVEDFMKEYLTWEIDLIKQVERDDLVSFRAF
jgi:rhodanese-related sulfurtransferase